VKANHKALHRPIFSQFQGKRKMPFVATAHEKCNGRYINWTLRATESPEHISQAWIDTCWIIEVVAEGTRDRKPFRATHLFLTSLRTSPEGLLRLVRDRWRNESWHWIRDTKLQKVAHHYRGNGAGAMASLQMAALNLLRFEQFQSIRAGTQALMDVITALQAMELRQPNTEKG
jgi:predicted transposase YbfD/YdcC